MAALNQFNPFARSKMKIVEPLMLVSCSFNGWNSTYEIEYRASRGAANVGLLQNQFKVGKPLIVQGKHVVVRGATFTVTGGNENEVTIRVEAVGFEQVLAGLVPATQAGNGMCPGVTPTTSSKDAPVIRGVFGPVRRRILA